MVIVMTPEATAEDVERIVEKVESAGGEAFVSKGVVRTIIGLVGDLDTFHGLNLRSMAGVADVHRISDPYKLVSRQHHAERSTVWVRGVPIGPDTFTFIAGPCAVESAAQTLEAAEMAKAAGATLMRGGAYKPRTSPYAFQGLGEAGLEILASVREATGLPGRHRGRRRPRRARRRRARRHAPGRHPQHGELRAAPGGRGVRQAGAPQARHERDDRGVADGGGVHRPARQPRRGAVRARDPDLRDRHPQHPRHLGGAGRAGDQPPPDHRGPLARSGSQGPGRAALAGRDRGGRRRRDRRRAPRPGDARCATGRRRCSAPSCARSPRRCVSCRRWWDAWTRARWCGRRWLAPEGRLWGSGPDAGSALDGVEVAEPVLLRGLLAVDLALR